MHTVLQCPLLFMQHIIIGLFGAVIYFDYILIIILESTYFHVVAILNITTGFTVLDSEQKSSSITNKPYQQVGACLS